MTRALSTRRRDDAGASLILAIILVLVVGLMAGAVLTTASASLRAGSAYSESAAAAQDIDGALKAAVNDVRTSTYNYTDGDRKCIPAKSAGATTLAADTKRVYYTPSQAELDAGRRQLAVVCRPGPTTGGMSELVPIACDLVNSPGTCNRPGNAILTLNPTSVTNEPGLRIDDRLLTVSGRVFSNSTIELNGSMCPNSPQPPTSNCVELLSKVPDFPIFARGRCLENGVNKAVAPAVPPVANQPRLFSTPAARCNYGSTTNVYGNDPNFAQPDSGTLTWQSVAACQSGQRTLVLNPGYYDDAAALSRWTNGNCAGNKTVVMRPGTYFFDFKNAEMASGVSTPAVTRGSNIWDISGSNVSLVAGTAQNGGALSGPIAPGQIPGVCRSPLDNASTQGVTMVFGGDSRIEYQSGHVELCGSYNGSSSPVVVYGAKADSANVAPRPDNGLQASTDGSPSPSPNQNFSVSSGGGSLASVLQTTETPTRRVATVTLTRNNSQQNRTGAFRVTGFTPSASIPAGSILTSAALTIRHQEQNTRTNAGNPLDSLSLTVAPTGGNDVSAGPVTVATSTSTYTDFTTNIADELMKHVHDNGFTGLSVELDAVAAPRSSGPNTWIVNVDQISLNLTYRLPSVRAQTNQYLGLAASSTNTTTVRNTSCMALVNGPYQPSAGGDEGDEGNAGSGCALLATTNAGHGDHDGTIITGEFYVQGTVYAPGAAIELILPHQNREAIRSGLIARSVRVNVRHEEDDEHGNTVRAPGDVSIEVPGDSLTTSPLDVYFTAYVCPSTNGCTAPGNQNDGSAPTENSWVALGWRRVGQARVQYGDADLFNPTAGQRAVKVVTWQVTG